jgi:hypothetical protein
MRQIIISSMKSARSHCFISASSYEFYSTEKMAEQRLLQAALRQEQVSQLSEHMFLDNYSGDEQEYQTLINTASALIAIAGRDLNIETTTTSVTNQMLSNGSTNTFSRTGIDRVAGLYVTGSGNTPGGVLVANNCKVASSWW